MGGKLRAVMAGCGNFSWVWLTSLRKVRDIEVVGLVDARIEAAQGRKKEFGLKKALVGTDLKAMLKAVRPDAVFDATPHKAHLPVTLAALRAGCHVLGEKPLAHSMPAARHLVAVARRKKRIFAVIQNRRYDANIQAFRALLKGSRLGRVHTLYCDFFMTLFPRDRFAWVPNPLLLDMAIHTFDQARVLTGSEARTCFCKEFNPPGSTFHRGASAIAIFEMANGMTFEYRGCWCPVGLNTTWEAGWRALGSRGSATWDGARGFAAQAAAGPVRQGMKLKDLKVLPVRTEKKDGHVGLLREFVDCVRTGRKPETSADENIKSLAMCFAAIRSSKEGRKVKVES